MLEVATGVGGGEGVGGVAVGVAVGSRPDGEAGPPPAADGVARGGVSAGGLGVGDGAKRVAVAVAAGGVAA